MESDKELLIEAIREINLEPREYSGRGMYGKSCLGVTTDSPANTALKIVDYATTSMADEQALDWLNWFCNREISTDSMGRDQIMYWEEIPYTDPSDE